MHSYGTSSSPRLPWQTLSFLEDRDDQCSIHIPMEYPYHSCEVAFGNVHIIIHFYPHQKGGISCTVFHDSTVTLYQHSIHVPILSP